MLIDSHCHLDMLELDALGFHSMDEVLAKAAENHVEHCLCVSVTWEDFPAVLALANRYPNVSASCGLHPNEQSGYDPTVEELMTAANHPNVVAIGETGLDYYRSEGDLTWQHRRFERHIEVAKALAKPLIIHTRQAPKDTIEILRAQRADEVGGVMHCFTESWAMAEAALALGFYISFSGIVTFKNAQQVQDVAKRVPLDRILVETDAPYLAPVPFRGKSNQPAYVTHVAQYLSELRGMSFEDFATQTTVNYKRLFAWN